MSAEYTQRFPFFQHGIVPRSGHPRFHPERGKVRWTLRMVYTSSCRIKPNLIAFNFLGGIVW